METRTGWEHPEIVQFLKKVLRHHPEILGFVLDEAGWTSIDSLLESCKEEGIPLESDLLRKIVQEQVPQRFEISGDGSRIRALQGHTVPVTLQYEIAEPPSALYHGTSETHLSVITADGINKGRRHDVHLSSSEDEARRAALRHAGCKAVVLRVHAARMHADGFEFRLCPNGIWLTAQVPSEYVESIEESS